MTLQTAWDAVQPRVLARARLLEVTALVGYLAWLAATLVRFANIRPLWYDELFTLHLARVASPIDLFEHLAAGVDLNPPLIYLLTRASILTFGESNWAIRFPALLGMLLGMICFYAFIRRNRGAGVALLSLAVCASSVKVWQFFIEARPYGLAFGFAGLALLSWQRRWMIPLAIACVLGVSSHYYFCVPIFMLGLAEIARQVSRKQFAWKPFAAFAMGGVALLAWYPLWSVAPKEYAAGFWAKVSFNMTVVQEAYWQFAEPSLVIPVLIAIGVALLFGSANTQTAPRNCRIETLALMLFAASPFVAVYLGAKVTGGMHYRYVLPAIFGFAGLFALAIDRIAGGAQIACILGFFGFITLGLPYTHKPYRDFFRLEANTLTEQATYLNNNCHGGIIIFEDGYYYARHWQLHHGGYQPMYLADIERSMHYLKIDTNERALQKLKRVTDVPACTLEEILADIQKGNAVFYYGSGAGWGRTDLIARGVRFDTVSEQGPSKLYRLRKD